MALPILDGNQTAATLSTVLTSGEHIPAHTVVSLGSQAITDVRSAVSGSVVSISNFPASQGTTFGAVTGSVSVLNFPSTQTIAGTVTANAGDTSFFVSGEDVIAHRTVLYSSSGNGFNNDDGRPVDIDNPLPISGTVTANLSSVPTHGVTIANSSVTVNGTFYQATQPISGTVTANISGTVPVSISSVTVGNSVTIGSLPAISGTVTISNFPRPTWTDYSGSVVTANSAVTAISTITRSYLLAQVTTGQMFLNIGATCTTGNGVYFSAGQGFAWETSVPQGIVSIISSVTGTNYVLKGG